MNRIPGRIADFQSTSQISLVKIEVPSGDFLWSLILEVPTDSSYLIRGKEVELLFKESEVLLARPPAPSLSILNCLRGRLHSWEKGELLSRLVLDFWDFQIEAILTNREMEVLPLEEGAELLWMVKPNEITLGERGK